jgi:hypothetical protein
VDESIRRSGRLVQRIAAALLDMHPAERRPFIRPLIALIERIVDGDPDLISASSAPANRDPHRMRQHEWRFLDDDDFGPR